MSTDRPVPEPAAGITTVHLLRHGKVHNPDDILYGRLPGYRLAASGLGDGRRGGRRARAAPTSPSWWRPRCCAPSRPRSRSPTGTDSTSSPTTGSSKPTTTFAGSPTSGPDNVLRKPASWARMRDPFTPSWGEPYLDIAHRMLAAVYAAVDAAAGHEAVIVSHQLPIWTVRRYLTGQRLWHNPASRAVRGGLADVVDLRRRRLPAASTTASRPPTSRPSTTRSTGSSPSVGSAGGGRMRRLLTSAIGAVVLLLTGCTSNTTDGPRAGLVRLRLARRQVRVQLPGRRAGDDRRLHRHQRRPTRQQTIRLSDYAGHASWCSTSGAPGAVRAGRRPPTSTSAAELSADQPVQFLGDQRAGRPAGGGGLHGRARRSVPVDLRSRPRARCSRWTGCPTSVHPDHDHPGPRAPGGPASTCAWSPPRSWTPPSRRCWPRPPGPRRLLDRVRRPRDRDDVVTGRRVMAGITDTIVSGPFVLAAGLRWPPARCRSPRRAWCRWSRATCRT